MRETEALMMFKPGGLNPSGVDSAIHFCKADKLGGVCSRKWGGEKNPFRCEKGLCLSHAYENAFPHPLPSWRGENIVRKEAGSWTRYFSSFDRAKIKRVQKEEGKLIGIACAAVPAAAASLPSCLCNSSLQLLHFLWLRVLWGLILHLS